MNRIKTLLNDIKSINLFCIFVIALLFTGCFDFDLPTTPFEGEIMRQVAYESLTETEKETLTISWEDALVVQGHYESDECENVFVSGASEHKCFGVKDSITKLSYMQKLGAVVFNTNDQSLVGPIIVIMDPQNNSVVGYVFRL
jgi:hypothetical protein